MTALQSAIAGLALAMSASAALAHPLEIERVGAGAFPISSIVVIRSPNGTDQALVSGTPGAPAAGDTKGQTIDALNKIQATLKSHGFDMGDVVFMHVYLVADPRTGQMDFPGMMAGYTQFFGAAAQPNKPGRTTVQVAGLALPGSLVEIDCNAIKAFGPGAPPAPAR